MSGSSLAETGAASERFSTIVALAGRRIDAATDRSGRFPLANVRRVKQEIIELLRKERAIALVCSAACGADLLALEAAASRKLRRRILLPTAPDRFRSSSVSDCPGDWEPEFESQISAVGTCGDLLILDGGSGKSAYSSVNRAIVNEAVSLAADSPATEPLAVVVWDGRKRGGRDVTMEFFEMALRAGLRIREIRTD